MKKIRVLQFPMANSYGGITQYVLQNWRYIDKVRFQFDFATLCKDKLYFEDEVAAQNCMVYHISCYAEEDKEKFSNEIRAILANGYDVVHLHTSYWKSFLVEEIAKEMKVPKVIVHAHNASVLEADHREERIAQHNKCMSELKESLVTDYWACSRLAAEWLYGNKISPDRIVIQKNAIDIEQFRYNQKSAIKIRNELGWEKQYIIGHVGRFTYQKNHMFLIRVFKKVHEKNPNVRLLLIGVGPEKAKIEQTIREWNLQDCIKMLEKRNDVNELMQAMNCFAFPSRFEGLPIVLVEAQASGCACVVSNTITKEIELTDSMQILPLDEDRWINTILLQAESHNERYIRNADILREQGFDLKDQIMRIEEGYLGINK